jgi:tRNA A-37 threonylcarbamoyl transferase component Bud32
MNDGQEIRVGRADNSVELLLNTGAGLFSEGQYQQAAAIYSECIRMNPDCAAAYVGRGRCSAITGKHSESVEDFSTAADLDPDSAHPMYYRAVSLLALGKNPEAMRDLNRSLELRPDFAEAYCARASELLRQNREPEAVADCTEAIRLQPDFAEAYYQRHLAQSRLGRADAAAEDREEAIRLGRAEAAPDVPTQVLNQRAQPEAEQAPAVVDEASTALMATALISKVERYEIIRELGRGGMGIVYLAHDTVLDRQVAIKKLLPPQNQDPAVWNALARRFIREARAAGSLNHPNLVAIYDVLSDRDATAIVMEYVKGDSLAKLVPLGMRAAETFTTGVLRQAASALDHAHSRGIVHRDIKPENIMLDKSGGVKIADFGIAKVLNSDTDLTHGFAIGTLEYMSPEQLEGGPVGGTADQYSLAVVAYRMLTGCRIFQAESMAQWCALIMQQEPVAASQRNPLLTPGVDGVLARGMGKTPAARYDSCGRFARELEAALR